MSKECFDSCPRIKDIMDDIDNDNILAGPLPIHADIFGGDDTGASRLLNACRDTYDCMGPKQETVMVKKGIFHKRLEPQQEVVCGLDAEDDQEDN